MELLFFSSTKGYFYFELQEDKDPIKLRITILKTMEYCKQDSEPQFLEQRLGPCTLHCPTLSFLGSSRHVSLLNRVPSKGTCPWELPGVQRRCCISGVLSYFHLRVSSCFIK